jgi:hypothetical protein
MFFHAQRLCRDPCHRAVLMNNLATSLAQHPAHAPFHLLPEAFSVGGEAGGAAAASSAATEVPRTRTEFLEAAQRWAGNAVAQARSVPRVESVNGVGVGAAGSVSAGSRTPSTPHPDPARPEECDEACAAALCTLGDVLILMGQPDEARKQFTAARKMAARTGQREVASLAKERVKELEADAERRKRSGEGK